MIMMIYKLEDHQKNSTGLEPGNRQDIAVNSTHNAKLVISHSLCLLFEEYIGQGWINLILQCQLVNYQIAHIFKTGN